MMRQQKQRQKPRCEIPAIMRWTRSGCRKRIFETGGSKCIRGTSHWHQELQAPSSMELPKTPHFDRYQVMGSWSSTASREEERANGVLDHAGRWWTTSRYLYQRRICAIDRQGTQQQWLCDNCKAAEPKCSFSKTVKTLFQIPNRKQYPTAST